MAKVPEAIQPWLTPGAILAAAAIVVPVLLSQFGDIDKRLTNLDAKLDRQVESVGERVTGTNSRIDKALEMLAEAAARDAKAQSDLDYLRGRIDRITEKLEIASGGADTPTYVRVKGGTVETLHEKGEIVFQPIGPQEKDVLNVPEGANVYKVIPRKYENFRLIQPAKKEAPDQ